MLGVTLVAGDSIELICTKSITAHD